MKKRILLVATSTLLAVSMMFTGCGTKADKKDGASPAPAATAQDQAPSGGSITMNLAAEPKNLNSILCTDSGSGTVLLHTIEGLTRLDKDGNPAPAMAESWTVSDNGMKYTFKLRDAKWSDGTAVTADDFKYGFTQLLTKEVASEYAYIGYYIKNGEEYNTGKAKAEDLGIKVVDPKTLEITLSRPAPFFPAMMAFYSFSPVNKAFYEKQDNGKKYFAEATNMIFNGPYMIKEWKHEESITLVKNPNYWNAKNIKLDEIKMLMIKDSNAMLNAFNAGQLDAVALSGTQVPQVKGQGKEVLNYLDGGTWYIEFNLNEKFLNNVNIRQALALAIDRQSFVTNVLKNNAQPAMQFTNPAIKGLKDPFSKEVGPQFKDNDVAKAKELYEKGLKELGLDKAPKVDFIANDSDTAKLQSQALQEMWKKNLGLEVTITSLTPKDRLDRMTKKQFSLVLAGWSADYNDAISFLDVFETGNGNNHTSYSSKDYDSLLKKAQTEADPAKRNDYLKQMEVLLMKDMPIAPVFFNSRDYTVQPKLKGVIRKWRQDWDFTNAYLQK